MMVKFSQVIVILVFLAFASASPLFSLSSGYSLTSQGPANGSITEYDHKMLNRQTASERCAGVVPPGTYNFTSSPLAEGERTPYIVHFDNLAHYRELTSMIPSGNGTYRIRNHYEHPVWLEGDILKADSNGKRCPNSLHDIRLNDSEPKTRIDPGKGVIISNMELFYGDKTYSGRMTFHVGCNNKGNNCATETLGNQGYGQIVSLYEWTTDSSGWVRNPQYGPKSPGVVFETGHDISYVDGQHLEMLVHSPDMIACPKPIGCTRSPTLGCPADNLIQYNDENTTWPVCLSDCALRQTDEACCRGDFAHSSQCTSSSPHMSEKCPQAFSWAYNDEAGYKNCEEQKEIFIEIGVDSDLKWWETANGTLLEENLKFFESFNVDPVDSSD